MTPELKHRCLMAAYGFGAVLAMAVIWFPSFMCRAGSAALLTGCIYMMWQRRSAAVPVSVIHYAPFLVGTNLIWMGLPWPVDVMTKAWADCLFLASSVGLLSIVYICNYRALNALSDVAVLGTNPHSEEG